jgi:hypothetical protein
MSNNSTEPFKEAVDLIGGMAKTGMATGFKAADKLLKIPTAIASSITQGPNLMDL